MQLLSFIDHCFDIRTFDESDLSNDILIGLLLLCKIVMGNMASSFEAIRKRYIILMSWIMDFSEPLEYLLILIVLIIQLNLMNYKFNFGSICLFNIFQDKTILDQYYFMLLVNVEYLAEFWNV